MIAGWLVNFRFGQCGMCLAKRTEVCVGETGHVLVGDDAGELRAGCGEIGKCLSGVNRLSDRGGCHRHAGLGQLL